MKFFIFLYFFTQFNSLDRVEAKTVYGYKNHLEETKSQHFTLNLLFSNEYTGRASISYVIKYGVIKQDTATIDNGKCSFTGLLFETTFLYLSFPDLDSPFNEYPRPIIISNGTNKLYINAFEFKENSIIANINDSLYLKYLITNKSIQNAINAATKKHFENSTSQSLNEIDVLQDSLNKFRINTIKSYSNYWISGYLLNYLKDDLLPKDIKKLYLELNDTVKISLFGREVENVVSNQVGNQANEFQTTTSKNERFQLMRETKTSSLTLVFFWATWCKPCKVMIPVLKRIHEENQTKGLKMIGIADNDREPPVWIHNITSLNLNFMTHLLMGRNEKVDIARLYAVQGIPVVVLIDSNGVIVYRQISNETEALEKFITTYYQE
jgi:thiol-disulfide isomerase/thioredoxin